MGALQSRSHKSLINFPITQFHFKSKSNGYLIEHDALGLEPLSRPDVFEAVQDLSAIAVFLMAELVRREGQNDQIVVSELLAELVHLREVSGCGAFIGSKEIDSHYNILMLANSSNLYTKLY